MWFKKPKQFRQPSMPKWMVWGLIIFVAVMWYGNSFPPAPNEQSPIARMMEGVKQELPPAESYPNVLPERDETKITALAEGSGIPVLCGQSVQLAYKTYIGEEVGEDGKANIIFGDNNSPFIHQAIASANIGSGHRYSFARTQSLSYLLPEAATDTAIDAIDIRIPSADPDYSGLFSENGLKLQINDKQLGQGSVAQCGDEVQLQIRLWDANGKEYFVSDKTAPLSLTIGKRQVILGLEQGIIGMGVNGVRMLVIPPAWQEQATGSAELALPNVLRDRSPSLIVAEITRVK